MIHLLTQSARNREASYSLPEPGRSRVTSCHLPRTRKKPWGWSAGINGLRVLQMRPGHAARMRNQAPQPAAWTLPALVPSHGRRVTCALIGASEPAISCTRSKPYAW